MAKWRTEEQAFEGAIRVVNYVDGTQRAKDIFGNEGEETPIFKWRIEQLAPWGCGGWKTVPVYLEQPDGSLVEEPQ